MMVITIIMNKKLHSFMHCSKMLLSPLFSSKEIDLARCHQRAFFFGTGDVGAAGIGVAFHHTHWPGNPDRMRSDHSPPPPSSLDWTRSQLGDRAAWPACLRLTVDIMLNTPLAMVLMWSREQIMVFNPAYAELCGTASQRAPGGTVPSMLPAVWSWNPAAIAAAWAGAASQHHGQSLPLWREGSLRQQRLDLYYTPVRDDTGQVAGILCALAAAATTAAPAIALTILLVEDNPDALYLTGETLRALGHQVTAVASGEEALPALAARHYDLLFADVSLPGMSGIDLARQALARQPRLQILFASGHGRGLTEHLPFPAEALQKPYDIAQLQDSLAVISARLHDGPP
jgi:CheY-like chemotaxis protein